MGLNVIIGDTASINIERTINLDTIDPVIYSDVYSDDLSINQIGYLHSYREKKLSDHSPIQIDLN